MKLKELKQIVKEEILIQKYGGVSLLMKKLMKMKIKFVKSLDKKFQQYFLNYLKNEEVGEHNE